MSAIVQVSISCDKCSTELDSYLGSIGQARREAKEDGWAFSRNQDICPDCRQRKPRGWNNETQEDTRNGNAETEV